MDKAGLDMFADDIDARIAKYDENQDNQSFKSKPLFKGKYEDVELHAVKKSSHKEHGVAAADDFHDSSNASTCNFGVVEIERDSNLQRNLFRKQNKLYSDHPTNKVCSPTKHKTNFSKRIASSEEAEEDILSEGSYFEFSEMSEFPVPSNVSSKYYDMNASSAVASYPISPQEYCRRRDNIIKKPAKQCVDSPYIKANKKEFSGNFSALNRSADESMKKYVDNSSFSKINTDSPYECYSSVPMAYSKNHFDPKCMSKRISPRSDFQLDEDKTHDFISDTKNESRMKIPPRNYYHRQDTQYFSTSESYFGYHGQNDGEFDRKKMKTDKEHRNYEQSKKFSNGSSYRNIDESGDLCISNIKKKTSGRYSKADLVSTYVSYSDIKLDSNIDHRLKNHSDRVLNQPESNNFQYLYDEGFRDSEVKTSNNEIASRIRNPSICYNELQINQIYQESSVDDQASTTRSKYAYSDIEHQRMQKMDEKSSTAVLIKPRNDELLSISRNTHEINLRKHLGQSTGNTLTMSDARKIAPLVSKCPIDTNDVEHNLDPIPNTGEDCETEKQRECWAKVCWSRTKHSHGINISKDLHAWKTRNAIVNSMQSPQYATKSKSNTCADVWSSFLKACGSRFQLWSRTLKKIEGQFGTGVVSYFVFLRWLILLNLVIFIFYLFLIILPYSVFALLPHQHVKSAFNSTVFTDEFLEQFPKHENVPFTRKRISLKNVSVNLNADLLSNLGALLDNKVPNEMKIVDATARYGKWNYTGEERQKLSLFCKDRYEKNMANHSKEALSFLQDFLQGTGWLQSTILFLGFYPDRDVSYFGLPYNLPISFIAVLIVSFFLSLVLMLQYSSHGIQENILTQKSNYLTFSNILFCSWDYCIEDKKTADIRHKSITWEIKSNLAEEHRKSEISRWSSGKKMQVYLLRVAINIFVIAALFGSFYLIYTVVNFQLEKQRQNALQDAGVYTLYIQFLPPLVITGLNIIMPMIFYTVVKFEMYNTQTQINIALFRIVFLRLASVFVLVSSLYQQITCEPKDQCRAGKGEYCRTPICWETYVGQQLYKLVITDFLVYICMFLAYDLPRDFIVQSCKCKVTEVVGRQVFDLPSQVLSLVYSQTLCWLGLFYSPLLAGISVLKFVIIFYIKKLVVLKHCVPAPVLYKASRSNSIFMTILMISLFVVSMIHGYSFTSIEPSPGCSPFRQYEVMVHVISDAISDWSPTLVRFMNYVFSGFFFVPAFLLLMLIIYYYWTVVVAHRKMTKILKAQIAVEGRDKQFLLNRLAEIARQVTAD